MLNNGNARKIVVWGLPGSGKTTFILAFLKSMRLFGTDMGWHFTMQSPKDQANDLFQKTVFASFVESHRLPARTQNITRLPVDLYYQNSKRHLTFDHSFEILDAPGEAIYRNENYLSNLVDADALICILDRSTANQGYLKALPVLQNYLEDNDNPKRLKVAFCLSRADHHIPFSTIEAISKQSQRDQQKTFRDLITSIIGKDVLVSIEQALHDVDARYFVTSSIGWIQAKNGDYFPNCTSVIGESTLFIYKPLAWQPHGIMETLFWLLDELDLKIQDPEMESLRYEQMIRLFWKWYKETDRSESFQRWIDRN